MSSRAFQVISVSNIRGVDVSFLAFRVAARRMATDTKIVMARRGGTVYLVNSICDYKKEKTKSLSSRKP